MTETPDPTQTPALTDRLALEADVADEAGTTWLADLLREAAVTIHQGAAAWRTFLERAVNHPGPPVSEMERYDPDADLAELEGAVIERLDLELARHRELMEIRGEAERILARTQDPSRSTVQVFKDLLAHFIAFHQHLEVLVTTANEQVASIKRAALNTIDECQAAADARLALEANTVAMLRCRCERYEGWWALPPTQRHPLGPEFSDGAGSSRPDLAEIEQIVANATARRYPNGGHHEDTLPLVERVRREIERGLATLPSREPAAAATFDVEPAGNAVAEHIRAAGGDPESATVAQIADALNATNYFGGGVTVPNATATGLEHTPDQRGVAVKLQWDSTDTFEVAPPKRITINLRQPATPPTPEEEADNAAYMARMMKGVKQAGAARPGWPLMPLEIVMQIGFATFKPEATSVIWAGKVISTGDADLSLRMENPVHEHDAEVEYGRMTDAEVIAEYGPDVLGVPAHVLERTKAITITAADLGHGAAKLSVRGAP